MSKENQIKEVLTRGVENVYPKPELLEKFLKSSKKLKIYYGIDPTGAQLHLGHAVQLLKLRQLQELGHHIIILIGDFTAMIGDPTDKKATRQPLTKQQVKSNYKSYKKQIGKILDLKKSNIKFLHNDKWSSKLKPVDMLELASHFTVAQLLERDMFQERIKAGKNIGVHEFLYPIFQAYDALSMDVDMQIGGNDQMFNMLAGRTLIKKLKDKEKLVLTTKLLVDPAGKKMGKTEGNMVSLDDSPEDMYGKVMSWPDNMIIVGFELLTLVPMEEVRQIAKELAKDENPKKYKMRLAFQIVDLYHDKKAAERAEQQFAQVFKQGLNPDEMPEFKTRKKNIIDVLVETKLAASKSEARRLIEQGAVRVDQQKVEDETFELGSIDDNGIVIQKGKRHFAKIIK